MRASKCTDIAQWIMRSDAHQLAAICRPAPGIGDEASLIACEREQAWRRAHRAAPAAAVCALDAVLAEASRRGGGHARRLHLHVRAVFSTLEASKLESNVLAFNRLIECACSPESDAIAVSLMHNWVLGVQASQAGAWQEAQPPGAVSARCEHKIKRGGVTPSAATAPARCQVRARHCK